MASDRISSVFYTSSLPCPSSASSFQRENSSHGRDDQLRPIGQHDAQVTLMHVGQWAQVLQSIYPEQISIEDLDTYLSPFVSFSTQDHQTRSSNGYQPDQITAFRPIIVPAAKFSNNDKYTRCIQWLEHPDRPRYIVAKLLVDEPQDNLFLNYEQHGRTGKEFKGEGIKAGLRQ